MRIHEVSCKVAMILKVANLTFLHSILIRDLGIPFYQEYKKLRKLKTPSLSHFTVVRFSECKNSGNLFTVKKERVLIFSSFIMLSRSSKNSTPFDSSSETSLFIGINCYHCLKAFIVFYLFLRFELFTPLSFMTLLFFFGCRNFQCKWNKATFYTRPLRPSNYPTLQSRAIFESYLEKRSWAKPTNLVSLVLGLWLLARLAMWHSTAFLRRFLVYQFHPSAEA